jgi:predicted methyltransferase
MSDTRTLSVTIRNTEHKLPSGWAICCTCRGNGRHSIGMGSFTSSELAEQGQDWVEDYMAGRFDSSCEDCEGTGKVLEVDRDRCRPDLLEAWDQEAEEEAEFQSICEHERRMGC